MLIGVVAALAACSDPQPAPEPVATGPAGGRFPAMLYAPEIEGLCYAPQSISFDGNFQVTDMPGDATVAVARVAAAEVENGAAILGMPRKPVTPAGIEVLISPDAVVAYPSYVQVVLFPCDAPTRPGSGVPTFSLLSARLYLTPRVPAGAQ